MKVIVLTFFVLISPFVFGQTPTIHEIKEIATCFLNKNNNTEFRLKGGTNFTLRNVIPIKLGAKTIYNVVETAPNGFIVISNNKCLKPIIAYSARHNFNYSQDTSSILYHLIINDIKQRESKKIHVDLWSDFLIDLKSTSGDLQQWPEEGVTSTGGWIETTWHQREPYNNLFPTDPVTNSKVLTGCVATAFAQLLNYHKTAGEYPLNSYSKYTSTGLNNTIIHIDNDYDKFDFASFNELNNYLNSVKSKYISGAELSETEISTINFLAAIMVKANFSSSGTFANIYNIPTRLKDYFQYASCDVSQMLTSSIRSSLKNNMKLGFPALLSVQNSNNGGHLIICDGYNTNDFFHFNFDWGDNSPENISDVWYNIPQNIPANYNVLNSVIYNIKPVNSGISISESLIELFPGESLSVTSFEINSSNSISLKLKSNQVLISQNNNSFSNELNLNFSGEDKKTIWVKDDAGDTTVKI